jgi:hypothetical protein
LVCPVSVQYEIPALHLHDLTNVTGHARVESTHRLARIGHVCGYVDETAALGQCQPRYDGSTVRPTANGDCGADVIDFGLNGGGVGLQRAPMEFRHPHAVAALSKSLCDFVPTPRPGPRAVNEHDVPHRDEAYDGRRTDNTEVPLGAVRRTGARMGTMDDEEREEAIRRGRELQTALPKPSKRVPKWMPSERSDRSEAAGAVLDTSLVFGCLAGIVTFLSAVVAWLARRRENHT